MRWVAEDPVREGDRWVQRLTALTHGPNGETESITREISASTREALAKQMKGIDLVGENGPG